jgi:hypothetical protein
VIQPIALSTSASRSLDAEMAGAPRSRVKELLTEELAFEHDDDHSAHWFMIDMSPSNATRPIDVSTARPGDQPFARELERAIAALEWQPWGEVPVGSAQPIAIDELPGSLRAAAQDRGWNRFVVAPVHVDDELAAAFVQCGVVPADYGMTSIKKNVAVRITSLVDITSLLLARWRDQDRLGADASRFDSAPPSPLALV